MSKNLDKANKLLLKLLKQKEKRDASAPKRINTRQNKKQRKLRVEQFLPKVRPMTKLEEQLEGVKRKRIMDLDYKKKLAELKTQRERQIESIATPSVETLIKQERRKAGRPKKVIDASALKQVKELYEMNVAELKEQARKQGIKTTQTKTNLIKQITELKTKGNTVRKTQEEIFRPELFKYVEEPAPAPIRQKEVIEEKHKFVDITMTKKELDHIAGLYGVSKSGNKNLVISRINKFISEKRQPTEAQREPTEAQRKDADKLARLFNEERYAVNPEIPAKEAFPQEEIAQGNEELEQAIASNDAYEAQKRADEANIKLPEKLVEDAKQNALMNAKNGNDENAVKKAVNKQAKKRPINKK